MNNLTINDQGKNALWNVERDAARLLQLQFTIRVKAAKHGTSLMLDYWPLPAAAGIQVFELVMSCVTIIVRKFFISSSMYLPSNS